MLSYYARKVHNTLLTRFATPLGNRQTGPGLLSGSVGDFAFKRRFVFYFADAQYVHLGDQLFHQPLISLWQRHGYDVEIATGPILAPYFLAQGLKLVQPEEYAEVHGAVIITKNDLAHSITELFPNGNFFVGVNYHLVEYPGPICVGLARAVYSALERLAIDLPPLPDGRDGLYKPFVPAETRGEEGWEKLLREDAQAYPSARGYLAYNDFVSSAYLEAKLREPIIREQGKRLKAEGYRLIYTGTEREKITRPNAPPIVDLDLRGKLSALDLYRLFAQPNVHGVICYDTFVMHVASALHKDLYVTMKKRGRNWQTYKSRYIPMYPGADDIVKECL